MNSHKKAPPAGVQENVWEVIKMSYPKTGNEVYVSFSLSNTMLSGIGKGTITREEVSADYRSHRLRQAGTAQTAGTGEFHL